MRSLILTACLTLTAWGGPAAALHPGALCAVYVPGAYSFKIKMPAVPAFYAVAFRDMVLSRIWSRLHNAYLDEHRGVKNRLSLIFDDHYFAVVDPLANPQKLLVDPTTATGSSARAPDGRALLYVFDRLDRVVATHPNHLLARRVLRQMVNEGEVMDFSENPDLTAAVRAVGGCQ